jgi:hypothetical protein
MKRPLVHFLVGRRATESPARHAMSGPGEEGVEHRGETGVEHAVENKDVDTRGNYDIELGKLANVRR